jgi:hypothetical protein
VRSYLGLHSRRRRLNPYETYCPGGRSAAWRPARPW